MTTAALLDEVIETLYARHTTDPEAASAARREYEDRRGKVHQDDPLWERWSAAFVEWYVVERVAAGGRPRAAAHVRDDDADRDVIAALCTSHRSLFEIVSLGRGAAGLRDLLGGGAFTVAEPRALVGVSLGDVAE